MQQQFPQDEPTQFHAFLGQLLRHLFIHIAESLDDEQLGQLMTMDNPAQLASLLSAHNDTRHQKLMSRRFTKPAAPNAQRPRMGNGQIDRDLEATRAVRDMFNSMIPKGGR